MRVAELLRHNLQWLHFLQWSTSTYPYYSFIHTEHLYSASSRELLRGAPDSSTAKKSSLKLEAIKQIFKKIPEKISFYPQKFLMTFFSHRKLQKQWNRGRTHKLAAARPPQTITLMPDCISHNWNRYLLRSSSKHILQLA